MSILCTKFTGETKVLILLFTLAEESEGLQPEVCYTSALCSQFLT